MADFEYDFDEIVQLTGHGPLTLRTAILKAPPGPIPVQAMLHLEVGKVPSFFYADQISELRRILNHDD